jgi:hypothetical protein
MRDWESQSHVKWYCRYHVVIDFRAAAGGLETEKGRIYFSNSLSYLNTSDTF